MVLGGQIGFLLSRAPPTPTGHSPSVADVNFVCNGIAGSLFDFHIYALPSEALEALSFTPAAEGKGWQRSSLESACLVQKASWHHEGEQNRVITIVLR